MDNLIGEIITKHWDIPIFLRASLVFNFLTWGPFEEGYIKRFNRQWYSKIQNLKICNTVYIIENNKWLEYQPYFDNRSTSFKFGWNKLSLFYRDFSLVRKFNPPPNSNSNTCEIALTWVLVVSNCLHDLQVQHPRSKWRNPNDVIQM